MAETLMSVKGQIVIPKAVRDRLKLEAGQRFEVDVMSDGSLLVIPVPANVLRLMELPGAQRLEAALKAERRKERGRDNRLARELMRP